MNLNEKPNEDDYKRAGGRPLDPTTSQIRTYSLGALIVVVVGAVAGAICIGYTVIRLFNLLFPV